MAKCLKTRIPKEIFYRNKTYIILYFMKCRHNMKQAKISILKYVLCILVSLSSNMLYVDEHCHALGWPLQFSRSSLQNLLVHITVKQVTVILCINCYTMRIAPSESQIIFAMILPADSCLQYFGWWRLLLMPFHAGPPWLWSEVVHLHLVTGPYSLLESVSFQFKLAQMFSRHSNMLHLLVEHLYVWDPQGTHFLNNKC
jgi:hypothetical protein